MKRILVTGAGGFLGRRLLPRLLRTGEYEILAVSSRDRASFPPEVAVERIDLLDPGQVAAALRRCRPEICVHLAWDQSRADYRNAQANYQWLAASIQLFSLFRQAGGRQFLFAGSSGEYEDRPGVMAEQPHPLPMSRYGSCKRAASELFLRDGGMLVQIARYFTIYGPGDTHRFGAIPETICTLLEGGSVSCRAPAAVRDYVYIDDAVEATARLLESGRRGAVNIGSGVPRSMREVFTEIARQLDCPERVSFADGGDAGVLVADTAMLREELGMREQTAFEAGIAGAIAYWREQTGAREL